MLVIKTRNRTLLNNWASVKSCTITRMSFSPSHSSSAPTTIRNDGWGTSLSSFNSGWRISWRHWLWRAWLVISLCSAIATQMWRLTDSDLYGNAGKGLTGIASISTTPGEEDACSKVSLFIVFSPRSGQWWTSPCRPSRSAKIFTAHLVHPMLLSP